MRKPFIGVICALLLISTIPSGLVFAQTEGTVTREVSELNPSPGEVVTVTIKPVAVPSFYAVAEDIDGLIYMGEHTADSNPEGTIFTLFTMLTPEEFNYEIKVPEDAKPEDKFVITGKFWTDLEDKKDIPPTTLIAEAPSPSPPPPVSGFEAILALSALLAVGYLFVRRRK